MALIQLLVVARRSPSETLSMAPETTLLVPEFLNRTPRISTRVY